jgi:NADPH-dependent curcumin reductase CurA
VALSALRQHGRVVACGAISQYNATERPPGPRNMTYVVTKRLRIEGFIVIDHFDKFPAFLAEVGPWVRDGKVAYRETVVEGLERAPEALLGLLTGENIGKMLVKIGPDP